MSSAPGTTTLTADGVEAGVVDVPPRVVTRAGLLSRGRARAGSKPLTRKEKIIRGVGIGLLACGTIAGVVVISAYFMAKMTPGWFVPQSPQDPLVIAAARRIENNVATVLTKVRQPGALAANQPASLGPDRWAISLSAQDANAWLSVRLPMWMESECDPPLAWPKEVGAVQVAFEGGRIYVGASLRAGGSEDQERVLTASIEPIFDEHGSLWTPARSIGLGRVAVPAGLIMQAGAGGGGAENGASPTGMPGELADLPQTKGVLGALAGKVPALRSPVLKIGDGRRVKLVGMEAKNGKLIITLETLTRGQ
jgi:hypothetical protein